MTIRPKIRDLINLIFLFVHDHSTKNWGPHWFIFFICTRPFDLKLGSSLIFFFYLHTTIRPKIRVLINFIFFCTRPFDQKLGFTLIYFFHLYATIWPEIRFLINLFFLFVHDHSTKNWGQHWFIFFICKRPFELKLGSSLIYFFYLYTTIRPKMRVLIDLLLLFAHDHSTKLHGPLSFILSLVHDHSTKN